MTAGRKSVSNKKDWQTPPKYVNAVKLFFEGVINLDPCSNQYSIVNAQIEYRLPEKDGLIETWNFKNIYVNPPYGRDSERGTRILEWIRRCDETHQKYNSEILALIPVATNTVHWKRHIFGKAFGVCFLQDTRLRFLIDGKDNGHGAPMACAMVYWGKDFKKFYKHFEKFGAVVMTKNVDNVFVEYKPIPSFN